MHRALNLYAWICRPLGFVEDFNGTEFFTFEHREAGASTGANVGDRVGKAELLDGRGAVATTDDAHCIALCDGFSHRLGPLIEGGISKTPIGPFQTTVFADLTICA